MERVDIPSMLTRGTLAIFLTFTFRLTLLDSPRKFFRISVNSYLVAKPLSSRYQLFFIVMIRFVFL